uniref:Uncharacterized protein n=1 Tax=Anopheles atroparvus TaxID=41427 RepID=A0A182IYY9_ANOAO
MSFTAHDLELTDWGMMIGRYLTVIYDTFGGIRRRPNGGPRAKPEPKRNRKQRQLTTRHGTLLAGGLCSGSIIIVTIIRPVVVECTFSRDDDDDDDEDALLVQFFCCVMADDGRGIKHFKLEGGTLFLLGCGGMHIFWTVTGQQERATQRSNDDQERRHSTDGPHDDGSDGNELVLISREAKAWLMVMKMFHEM